MGPYCASCNTNCGKTGCAKSGFEWGFDGCLLKARLNGAPIKSLNLCKWLYCNQTDTQMRLVPNGVDSYIEYLSERDINACEGGVEGETDKVYICDMLGLGKLSCLGDVAIDNPQPCDIMVYHPFCGSNDCEDCNIDKKNKWVNYHIPDAGDCELQPDASGHYKVLTKDACGCIKECKLKNTDDVFQYSLRDSVPNDPDWPFTYGQYTEDIDLMLEQKVPELFGKTDLKVTIEYSFGIQHCNRGQNLNFKSVASPVIEGMPVDHYRNAWITQMNNLFPWGSWEAQTSRTVLVPKGKKLRLNHQVSLKKVGTVTYNSPFNGQKYDGNGEAKDDSSRLHALVITVEACRRRMK